MLNLTYETIARRAKQSGLKKTGGQYLLTHKDLEKLSRFPRKQRKCYRIELAKEYGISENMLRNACSRCKLGFIKDREYIRIAMAMYKTGWFKYKGIRALVKQDGILERLGIKETIL